jgi:hypothetical protein
MLIIFGFGLRGLQYLKSIFWLPAIAKGYSNDKMLFSISFPVLAYKLSAVFYMLLRVYYTE